MESDAELQSALREAERGEVAPWLADDGLPRWYPLAFGTWAAGVVLTYGLFGHKVLFVLLLLAHVLAIGTFLGWLRRRLGTWPDPTHPPDEFRRPLTVWSVAYVALFAAVVLLGVLVDVVPAAVVAFVGFTGLSEWYERATCRAADEARRRLGS